MEAQWGKTQPVLGCQSETMYEPLHTCLLKQKADSRVNDGKCEDVETKKSCWAGELGTIRL